MKKETKSFFSFMKTWVFWIMFGAFSFTCFFIYQNRKVIERDRDKDMLSCSDSLKLAISENATLRKALAAKMESHCDTMTVEQNLAQQKLDEYTEKMSQIKVDQMVKLDEQKDNKMYKLIKGEETADNDLSDVYSKMRYQALLRLEKIDPQNFLKYVITCFKHDQAPGGTSFAFYEQRTDLEKNVPAITEYDKADKRAWEIRSKKGEVLKAEYQVKEGKLKADYENQLAIIYNNYQKKIADKKVKLGL